MPDAEADIVTTSHQHYDHNYIKGIKGNFCHIHKPGEYNVSGIEIKGIPHSMMIQKEQESQRSFRISC